MKRVLFVDDEPRILDGLRRMLFALCDEWEMEFVESGEAAVELLGDEPFDVLVTDMRMPSGMDGAGLLRWAQQNCPDVVRIVLSGYADEQASLRAVAVAHQFLNKPCSATQLRAVVERACRLRDMLAQPELREGIGGLDGLPALPRTYQQLTQMLASEDVSMREVGEVVSQDGALAAKVLQLVNSAFFALPREVSSVPRAVAYLGATMLRNVVLAAETFEAFRKVEVLDLEVEQNHALAVARLAQEIARPEQAEDAFVAGLLHDIGRLALAVAAPERLAEVEKLRAVDPDRARHLELMRGLRHDHVGAYLLGIWGLPYGIVEAAAFHHEPELVASDSFDLLCAVYVANSLVGGIDDEILGPFVERFGYGAELSAWRELAAEAVGEPST